MGAELEQARDEAQRAKRARKEYEDRAGSLKSRKSEIVEQALEEAERIVGEANARVERTIREIKEAQAATEQTREAREKLEGFKQQVERKKQRKVRRTPKPKPETAKVEGGPIRVGDQVRLDDGQATGEVLEIDEKEAVVALGQMKVRAKLTRLTKVGGKRKQRVEVRAPRGERASGQTSMPALDAQRRVDIRGQRVEEAIPVVMRLVDGATMAGLQMVEVLHGTGTGALRAAIREYLDTRAEVSRFDDAPWEEGGPGVTVVSLR